MKNSMPDDVGGHGKRVGIPLVSVATGKSTGAVGCFLYLSSSGLERESSEFRPTNSHTGRAFLAYMCDHDHVIKVLSVHKL